MSYRVDNVNDGLNFAMRDARKAMKGMPDRTKYLRTHNALARQVALLIIMLHDARNQFNID